ncbi:MAG: 5-oxoprolinase subunit PxpB [Chitinophagia bacterium]|jgi:inhibitor of KinA|nr:5-oxoprolinase subunit PxpB [Chitinophagia bacterium]
MLFLREFILMVQHQHNTEWKVKLLGDHAIQFCLPEKIDPFIVEQIQHLNQYIMAQNLLFFKDCIPSYHTLTVIFDLNKLGKMTWKGTPYPIPLQLGQSLLKEFLADTNEVKKKETHQQVIQIPVCYDISLGSDLAIVAKENNIGIEDIIQKHCQPIYQVYCIGFLPGFAYMGKVDKAIQSPRHATPRPLVMAGSVGIAGAQTGIYPMNSPGGWKIIGRTPKTIFNKEMAPYAKFKMGDQVQFFPISLKEFTKQNEYAIEHT